MTSMLVLASMPVARAVGGGLSAAKTAALATHAAEGRSDPAADPEPAPAKGRTTSPKVLIVEDATELAEVIIATLERINIQAFHETHVDPALAVYHVEHPDVILLDIGLPDKTGWKLLDAIRENSEEKSPVVIVITAHGDPANRLMGKLQGVHSYLVKPFTPDEVERVVEDVLAGKPPTHKAPTAQEMPLPDFLQKVLEGLSGESGESSDFSGEERESTR